jgi:PAS domain-containing protein
MFQRIVDLCKPDIQLIKGIILILDQDGKIISFNTFFESVTGYSYPELIQKNWFQLLLPEKERGLAKRYFRQFILRGEALTKKASKTGAVQNLSILKATAEPKTLDASFAPKDHPRKTPPNSESIRHASSY